MLKNALVSKAICNVDETGAKYLSNPYSSEGDVTLASIAGSYAVTAWTTTDDTISVTDQATRAEHIYEFEETLTRFNVYQDRIDKLSYKVALAIDQFVVNKVTDIATGAYSTPAGGFTTSGNINKIIADLASKVLGYAESYNGLFLVLENTDITGLFQAQMTNGFNWADMALKNGFVSNYGGIDIYVVRSGTYQTATLGTLTAVNSGHRLFGVKNQAVMLNPRGVQYDEKKVTLKTGREVAVFSNVGAGIWTNLRDLLVDITIV